MLSVHLFLIVWLLLTGCGYHLSATSGLPPAVAGKNLAISIFTNKSYRANVGATLTESLVDEFARRSGGKVVSEESADLVLNGTVQDQISRFLRHHLPAASPGKFIHKAFGKGGPHVRPVTLVGEYGNRQVFPGHSR